MSESMGCRAYTSRDLFRVTSSEKGEPTKAVVEAKDQIHNPNSWSETSLAFAPLGDRTNIAQTPLASDAPTGINARHHETHEHLSDHELWEKLRKSGRPNVSSREFADRASTRIDPEILRSINASFKDEDKASIRPDQKPNYGTPRGTHSIVPPHVRAKLGRWYHANAQDRDSLDNTPLHRAVTRGELPVVIEFLIHKGINVNALNGAGETALFIAASNGRSNLVKALLKMGASPKLRNRDGISPLKAASIKGHITTVNELMGSGAKNKARKSERIRNTGRRPQPSEKRHRWEQEWLYELAEGDLR